MFKKIKKNPVKTSIVLIISVATIGAFIILWPFYFIGGIEPGELIMEEASPTGEYTVKTYLNRAHSTVDYAVLGVLEYNDKNKKDKNILTVSNTRRLN
ncbi:DUF5412 family protein [Jeotgalibacillus sp. R-1-5s-1]|uniref:DUF5412 family protein n=1 Tax=Jeotgalibacillus sp. R-1-5s-1 TaxID=2555897 RepID=UPI00106D76E2|nr:DUF5412 family protein [Jeotgalibacillus sp. R-1-5s-1]TFD94336.1 hypothetical protein E2491_12890 [Jeotgalibacillus sp. R-1-5s-1]